ncbi:TLD-domain-containing protein, partial [Yamadazyma tenuis ATCC 10573]
MILTNGHVHDNKRPLGYVMVIRDSKGNRFGCYLNEHLHPMEHRRYYGNGECFLWKLEKIHKNSTQDTDLDHHRFKAFMYTGINDNIIYSNHDFIAIGSSKGQNGLWIGSNLLEGVSYRCDTFGNEVLNGIGDRGDSSSFGDSVVGKFKILGLEIWRIGTL